MEGRFQKKAKMRGEDEQDRMSTLPDELVHHILKFVDTKLAVQTSILSKRWKLIWTTLPFLDLKQEQCEFISHVLSHRNHESRVSKVEMLLDDTSASSFPEFVEYAISHHVQCLNLVLEFANEHCKLPNLTSTSIRQLKMVGDFRNVSFNLSDSTSWILGTYGGSSNILEHCFTCLPALTTLRLACWDFQEWSFSFSLPALTSLHMFLCKVPTKVWNFPALKSLVLYSVEFLGNMSEILAKLVNLQNLTLCFCNVPEQEFYINCPQLVSLEIKTDYNDALPRNIVVFASKLRNFTSLGIFTITFGVSKLDNVNVKLDGWIDDDDAPLDNLKKHYQRFTIMLHGFGNARIVKLDLETIEITICALSLISDYLACFPSPFYSLKFLKIPQGYKEEIISKTLRNYLLGGSPAATIVTTLPQDTLIPYTVAASVAAQNVVREEPLAAPTKVLVDLENINETMCFDTVGLQEGHVVQNSEVSDDRVIKHVGAPVEGTGTNRVSSSEGKSHIGLWLGHEVKSKFVSLLDHILNKYPETFERFATKNKELCTMKLNMLCTTLNNFSKILMTEVDTEMISEYRDVFDGLQKFGFDISWLVSRLSYVEQLRFSQPLLPELQAIDCHIDDVKSKLQDLQIDETETKLQNLQTLRAEKMQEIEKAFGTIGTELAVGGYIGDGLLPGPS